VSAIVLSGQEEEELYVILKPSEVELGESLGSLLRRIEKALFDRLTVEEIEQLAARFRPDR
jgi:hypothetical protein